MSRRTTASQEKPGLASKPWWPWLKRFLTWAFLALVAWLIVRQAQNVDWQKVGAALQALPPGVLLGAMAIAAASHALYASFDLLGRRMTGHGLATKTVLRVAFISYAFNLNLGSIVGGMASRVRLYLRLGLEGETVTKIIGFTMLTNWFGYLALGGLAFAIWPMDLPPDWKLGSGGLRIAGIVMLVLAAAYLVLCAVSKQRVWLLRGRAFRTPTFRMALLQMVMAMVNWSLIAAIIWLLLQNQVGYAHVVAVALISAVAGVITHVPGNLGVLEAVFIALLGYAAPRGELLAALLVYRAAYYLLPLALATLLFALSELKSRQRGKGSDAEAQTPNLPDRAQRSASCVSSTEFLREK